MMKLAKILGLVLALLASTTAMAGEIIANGGFETGDFNGWAISDVGSANNNMYISSSTTAPFSGFATPGAKSGSYYAVSDQNSGGSQTLMQSFTTVEGASYVLSYDMFVNSHVAFDPNNQFSSVDLLASTSSMAHLRKRRTLTTPSTFRIWSKAERIRCVSSPCRITIFRSKGSIT